MPRLSTDVAGLDAYYRRSLASGLVCLWDNPAFVTTPFVATSALDGGAVCGFVRPRHGEEAQRLPVLVAALAAGRQKAGRGLPRELSDVRSLGTGSTPLNRASR